MEKALKRFDKDYIHYMIETEPTMSISKIVNLMKIYTTYPIWEKYPNYLRKHFWKEHTFWTDISHAAQGMFQKKCYKSIQKTKAREGGDSQC